MIYQQGIAKIKLKGGCQPGVQGLSESSWLQFWLLLMHCTSLKIFKCIFLLDNVVHDKKVWEPKICLLCSLQENFLQAFANIYQTVK